MLNGQDINKIETKTRQVIGDYIGDLSTITPPVDVTMILNALGLQLIEADFDDPAVSGAFDRTKKSIFLSVRDSKTRQLFTVAHELGHYFLNPDKNTDIFYRREANEFVDFPSEEQEANWFAAALLMPRELITKIWNQEKDEGLVAAYFGVSQSAAHWRLKNVKLL